MTRRLSITFRLTLYFSIASSLVLLVIGYWVGAAVERHFVEQDVHEFAGKIALIGHTMTQDAHGERSETTARRLADALVGHHGLVVAGWGGGGQTLYASADAAVLQPLLALAAAGHGAGLDAPQVWQAEGRDFRGVVVDLTDASAPGRALQAALALDIGHHRDFLGSFRHNLWAAVLACILSTAFLGWVAARRGLRPVRDMAVVARGISASRLQERLALDAVPPELAGLAIAFNDMLERLEGSFRRLSDFSSDLAHELRTPISNLMTQAQVALGKARSPEEYREVLYSSLEEYDRLAGMISDMLFLAQADHGRLIPTREPVELSEEVAKLFEFFEAWSEECGVQLQAQGAGRVMGDAAMLRRALSNLLANALHHSASGTEISIEIAEPRPGWVRLSVSNAGETIPPEHLPRLFDRFYRVDPARQRSHEGAGLGLAITRSIIAAHGGSIGVRSESGRTKFALELPGA